VSFYVKESSDWAARLTNEMCLKKDVMFMCYSEDHPNTAWIISPFLPSRLL